MRGFFVIAALACVVASMPAAASAAPATQAAKARACSAPLGPVDKRKHSTNLRVRYIRCPTGRLVARRCVFFTYGRSGRCKAAGRRWRCKSKRVGRHRSTQRCTSGRRVMSILWRN